MLLSEKKRLAESNKDDADNQKDKKEKTKELCIEDDGNYDGK
jgi:hypothetical protein